MPKEVAASAGQEHWALVLASNLADGAVIKRVLADAGVETINYATAEELLNAARAGVGTIIIRRGTGWDGSGAPGGILWRGATVVPRSVDRFDGAEPLPLPNAEMEAKRCGFAICAQRDLA